MTETFEQSNAATATEKHNKTSNNMKSCVSKGGVSSGFEVNFKCVCVCVCKKVFGIIDKYPLLRVVYYKY